MVIEQGTERGIAQRIVEAEISEPLAALLSRLDRFLPLADRLARVLVRLALASIGSGAVISAVLVERRWPLSVPELLVLGVLGLVLLAPAAVLVAYRAAVLRFRAASDRLRALPEVMHEQANRLDHAVAGVRVGWRGGAMGTVGSLRELVRASRAFRGTVDEYSPLVAAANPTFVATAAGAAILVPVEVGVAAILFAWTALR